MKNAYKSFQKTFYAVYLLLVAGLCGIVDGRALWDFCTHLHFPLPITQIDSFLA